MAGAYCRYCDHRCFVDRTLPDFSWGGHTTALNLIAPAPNGLHLRQVGDSDTSEKERPMWTLL
jgi:hypothetical protein